MPSQKLQALNYVKLTEANMDAISLVLCQPIYMVFGDNYDLKNSMFASLDSQNA
jgi:hypothetical protein